MRDQSQHGEAAFIKAMFPPDFQGTVLEVGAYSPIHLSNSRLFIEAKWSAILVEPSPSPLRALVQEYGNNEKVAIYAASMGAQFGDLMVSKFQICDGPFSTDISSAFEMWKKDGAFYGSMYVPVLPANYFADLRINFLSVDTEGNSSRVLEAMLLHAKHLPEVICVEREDADPGNKHINYIAEKFGYWIVKHEPSGGVNRILRKRDFV